MSVYEPVIKTFSGGLVFIIEYMRIYSAKSHSNSKTPSLTKALKSYFFNQ
jgi:hypothetical protein